MTSSMSSTYVQRGRARWHADRTVWYTEPVEPAAPAVSDAREEVTAAGGGAKEDDAAPAAAVVEPATTSVSSTDAAPDATEL
jgi:hypothetical protein